MMKFMNVIKLYALLMLVHLFISFGCDSPADKANDSKTLVGIIASDTMPSNAVKNALPFNLEFVEKDFGKNNPLPRLQSYSIAVSKDGYWVINGGRRQGLHTFKPAPANNFIRDSSNNFIYLINPANAESYFFDVNKLPSNLSAPLQSTNQQFYYDSKSDYMYLIGGYGWNADKTDMLTFNTIIRYKVDDMVAALKSSPTPQQMASLFQISQSDSLAVTGGELFKLGTTFYLVFGQKFTGQYRAFGGSDFEQKYTEEVRKFTLRPNTLKILSYGATTNNDADQPFHRRDGNIINDIDPTNGKPRIAAFGGVFRPGIIGAYTNPVYISSQKTPVVDRTVEQRFSQYGCPVISIYDSTSRASYHTFFGGIGHYYYSQTNSQRAIYDSATIQGRNDGFPFVADITTFLQTADGKYKEWIHTKPTPQNRLVGSSVPFILNKQLEAKGYLYENEVIKLASIPKGTRLLIGYIYGGVEAQNPLPKAPNTGTFVSNSIFEVYLTITPTSAIPASLGHESLKKDQNLKRE
jgi:hypothetical protein